MTFFSGRPGYNVTTMGEQDDDHKPWGGANTKLIKVAAAFASALEESGNSNSAAYWRNMAERGLAYWTYYVDSDGCPSALEQAGSEFGRGGWQEDAHTDVVHNIVDALTLLGYPYASSK